MFLRLVVRARGFVHIAEVVQARRHVRMLGSQRFFRNGERPFMPAQRLLIGPCCLVHCGEVIQACRDEWVLRTEYLFSNGECSLVQFGSLVERSLRPIHPGKVV